MAQLTSQGLTLEVRYTGLDKGEAIDYATGEPVSSTEDMWIHYDVDFYWGNTPVFNRKVRSTKPQDKKEIFAHEYQYDFLVQFIRLILETAQPDFWTTADGEITIAIYPGTNFPFMQDPFELQRYVMAENVPWFMAETVSRAGGEMAEPVGIPQRFIFTRDLEPVRDIFTVITLLDAGFFNGGEQNTTRNGVSLQLVVEREILEKFADDLEAEYEEFCRKHGFPET